MKTNLLPRTSFALTSVAALVVGSTAVVRPAHAADPKIAGPTAFVRVLHAVPFGPKVDVFIDGEKKLNDVQFGALSKYLRLRAGYHTFRVTSNNPTRTLLSGARTLRSGDFYTLSAYGPVLRPRLMATNESQGQVAFGRARLTAYHLAPGAPPVNVVAITQNGRALRVFSRLRYGQMRAAYVPAVPMTIQLRALNGGVLKTITGVSPRAGLRYSAFAIGRIGAEIDSFRVLLDRSASQ